VGTCLERVRLGAPLCSQGPDGGHTKRPLVPGDHPPHPATPPPVGLPWPGPRGFAKGLRRRESSPARLRGPPAIPSVPQGDTGQRSGCVRGRWWSSTTLDDMTNDPREAAWWRIHEALERLPGWRVTPASDHADEHPATRWHVTAVDGRNLGRRTRHPALEGVGPTEIEALEMLARLLEERFGDPPGRVRIRVPPSAPS
jgi:hypothetical protein